MPALVLDVAEEGAAVGAYRLRPGMPGPRPGGAPVTAEAMVREFIAVLREAKEAANRSVLDGTVSCRICRALVLEENSTGHDAWHAARGDR